MPRFTYGVTFSTTTRKITISQNKYAPWAMNNKLANGTFTEFYHGVDEAENARIRIRDEHEASRQAYNERCRMAHDLDMANLDAAHQEWKRTT